MQFPEIIKELEMRKKNKDSVKGTVMVAITQDKEDGIYTLYTNSKLSNDPFIKTMLTRIQRYIETNYEED